MTESSLVLIKRLEGAINSVLSGIDLLDRSQAEQRALNTLRQAMVDARLEVRDYGYAETRQEQLYSLRQAHKRLDTLQRTMLLASEYGIFGAVDVAQITAQIETIKGKLE